jgi:hypothetical protein
MTLSIELIEQLTPKTPAPGEDALQAETGMKDRGRLRRLAWTRFLRSKEFYYKQIEPLISREMVPWHVGVGLVPTLGLALEPPEDMYHAVMESGYTWGILFATVPFASAEAIRTRLDFERSEFPIIVSPTSIELHGLALNSTQNAAIGSRTSWAIARQVSRSGVTSAASAEGLLTARHVPDRAGQSSLWSSDAQGVFSVYRRGSTYVDAVYLEGSWGINRPSTATPKSVDLIATGDMVTLSGAYSNHSCFVTHPPNPHYIGGGSPSHIFLDRNGVPGDSGGLVHDSAELISMYIGKATLKNGNTEGISLSLEQVVNDLEIDLLV